MKYIYKIFYTKNGKYLTFQGKNSWKSPKVCENRINDIKYHTKIDKDISHSVVEYRENINDCNSNYYDVNLLEIHKFEIVETLIETIEYKK